MTGPSCHFMTKTSQARRGENDDSSDNQDSGMAGGSGSSGPVGTRLGGGGGAGRTHDSGNSRSTDSRTDTGGGTSVTNYPMPYSNVDNEKNMGISSIHLLLRVKILYRKDVIRLQSLYYCAVCPLSQLSSVTYNMQSDFDLPKLEGQKHKHFFSTCFYLSNGSTGLCFTTMTTYVCFCFHFGQNFVHFDWLKESG